MRKTLMALAAAGSLATATVYTPSQAQATPWWVAPAIVFGTIGGLTLGAAIAQPYYDPRVPAAAYPVAPSASAGAVYVRPTSSCYITREWIGGRMRRVEVCQ
ncbi:MAG: hypothetical protein IRZ09_13610 [Variibacter sp.]|nr:hypothetical protein [Variibacter sp.]